jgi:hypothetical protein
MNSRPFEEGDLAEISGWFASLEWPLPPIEGILPNLGVVVEEEGRLLACGWLYTTGTSLAFLSWTASSPKESPMLQSMAMEKLVTSIQEVVSKHQDRIKVVMALTKSAAFLNKLKGLQFRSKPGFDIATWIVKE